MGKNAWYTRQVGCWNMSYLTIKAIKCIYDTETPTKNKLENTKDMERW